MEKKILLVEDLPKDLEKLKDILERKGYRVSTAESYAQTRQLLLREVFDLGLVDLRLDEETNDYAGVQVLDELKQRRMMFIVLSRWLGGAQERWLWDHYQNLGLCATLPKPRQMEDESNFAQKLLMNIDQALERVEQARKADGLSEKQKRYIDKLRRSSH